MHTPIVEVLVEERTQLFFDGAAQDNAVCHRIVVDIVKAQAGVIGQSATRCGKRGNKTGNLRLLSVFIPLRVLRKSERTYTTLWNSSQIKRHLGLMPVSLFRAIRGICRRKIRGRVRTGAEQYLELIGPARSLRGSGYCLV